MIQIITDDAQKIPSYKVYSGFVAAGAGVLTPVIDVQLQSNDKVLIRSVSFSTTVSTVAQAYAVITHNGSTIWPFEGGEQAQFSTIGGTTLQGFLNPGDAWPLPVDYFVVSGRIGVSVFGVDARTWHAQLYVQYLRPPK